MNTTQLECFMEVANVLNFSRAAERLQITQPAVSHQINTLENELGVKLFHRTSKSVRLTQEGFLFIQYAGEILKLTDVSKARMKESKEEMYQRIVIGCRNTNELRILCPALEEMRIRQPRVLPVLRLLPFDSMENLLAERNVDLMFSFQRKALNKLTYHPLARCPVVCVCAQSHPLAARESVTVEELQGAGRIAACRPPSYPSDLFAVQSLVVGGREPGQVLFCDDQEVAATLVETGYAFTVMADLPQARLPALRYIPIRGVQPLSYGAVYLPGERNPILRQLVKLMEESMERAGVGVKENKNTGPEHLELLGEDTV